MIAFSFPLILLSVSHYLHTVQLRPHQELDFLTSVFSLFTPQLLMLPPQHKAAKKMTLATTE